MMKRRKDKSIVAMLAEIQVKAPSFKTNSFKIQLKGTVTPNTKTTAAPRPTAVLTFLETARKEHIPKKYAKIMLSMKIDRIPKLNNSMVACLN
jgi:hypothetical protein